MQAQNLALCLSAFLGEVGKSRERRQKQRQAGTEQHCDS
jgi:hypothetical protein